jgi:phenylacetaldehyde dehydrogenase
MNAPQTSPFKSLMIIDGKETPAASGNMIDVRNPATAEVFARVPAAGASDVDRAVEAAQRAFDGGWSRTRPSQRFKLLNLLADLVDANIVRLAALETQCNGRPISEMRAQLPIVGEILRYNASLALAQRGETVDVGEGFVSYLERSPLGVCAILAPFNHPLTIMSRSVAPALAAGNTVVIKPSELTPLTAIEFAKLSIEAGLPPGVVNVVVGYGAEAGAALAEHALVKKIDFTGGEDAGRSISVAAARRFASVTTELGGKSPVIIFDDAGLERAVNGAAFAGFVATGQTCVCGSRLLVQSTIYEAFTQALKKKVESLRVGDPTDPATQLGPLVSRRQLERTERYVEIGLSEGAKLLAGGRRPPLKPPFDEGYFYEPTLLGNVTNRMRCSQEEIFGPVVVAVPFDNEQDAVAMANDIAFGLGAAVWTRDVARAHRVASQIQAGMVWINDHHRASPSMPWGGVKASGTGKQTGTEAFETFTSVKSVIVRTAAHDDDWFSGSKDRRLN